MPEVRVTVTGLEAAVARLQGLGPAVDAEVTATVRWATELVYNQARENIESMFRYPARMANALKMTVETLGAGSVRGTVSIEGIGYVTQETGGRGPYDIFPRNRIALAWSGEGLPRVSRNVYRGEGGRFVGGGSEEAGVVFAKHVHHPPLPQRSYLRRALDQRRGEIIAQFHAIGERVRTRTTIR